HLALSEVGFCAIQGNVLTSPWTLASATLFEVRGSAPAPDLVYWALGLYPQVNLQRPQMIYLTSDDWSMQWIEAIRLIMFYRSDEQGQSIRYCVMVNDQEQFVRLVYLCSNIRMCLYSGIMFT
ncbi:hypothetical protein FKP32DRAFT_1573156, partial [Trametes sanguinea]